MSWEQSANEKEEIHIKDGDCLNGTSHAVTDAIMAQIQR
jgi:hypothetical protein